MTRRALVSGLTASACVAGLVAQTPPRAPQTFRAATDVVLVDVSVRDGGRMITGLGIDDFVLSDNGVRQTVESVETTIVPIDLTLVVDVSGHSRRPWLPRIKPDDVSASVADEVRRITTLLRPIDRVRLLAIDTYVHQVWPMQPISSLPPVRFAAHDGLGAVYETLAAALLQSVEPSRRHVVIARTKGIDTVSSIDAQAVRAIAEKSDALFHLAVMEAAIDVDDDIVSFQGSFMDLIPPTNRFWVPRRRQLVGGQPFHIVLPEGLLVRAGVEATGGSWHQTVGLAEPSLAGTFRDAFENFRQSYVLRYTPRGVIREGWHRLAVTVPGARGARVSARRGYGIEEAPPRAPSIPVAAVPRTLTELTHAYDQGAYQNVVAGLRQTTDPARLMRDFDEAGNPWPATPDREAAFVVELAEPGLFFHRAPVRDQTQALLERFARLIRHPFEPQPFERQWYYTVLTLLQGAVRPAVTELFADRALARFPDEPRFLLARAISADQRSAASGAALVATLTLTARTHLERARELYEAALSRPEVEAEARLRLAYALHRLGQDDAALARLTQRDATSLPDGHLRYLHHLFRGHVLAALGRGDEAIAAYRSALALLPPAQSARVSLMNALYRRGDREEAEALSNRVQTESASYTDPWWMYWQGQYRLYSQALARLREMAQ